MGDCILDSSEKLLQRGSRGVQYMCNFSGKGVHAIKHIFFAEGFCSHEEQMSSCRRCKNWAHKTGS